VLHGWPALGEGMVLGQVTGVDVDSHGHVFVFHRADRPWLETQNTTPITEPTLLRLEAATGRIEEELGAGAFVVPHGLRVDHRDHLWVTDVGTHTVHELDHDGTPLRSFGTFGEPGDDDAHFDQPTDVAVAADGRFFVADGYGNARVVAFDADGRFVRAFGERGSAPGQLDTPHSIALDADGRLLVADRGNARIQRFTTEGELIDVWQSAALGRPWAVDVDARGKVYVVDGGDQNPVPPDRSHILRLGDDGEIEASWASFGNQDGQLYWGHAVAVTETGEVLVGDVRYGMRVQKWTPSQRVAAAEE
jgi:DNA-binding beta-propeller fold protein YncE